MSIVSGCTPLLYALHLTSSHDVLRCPTLRGQEGQVAPDASRDPPTYREFLTLHTAPAAATLQPYNLTRKVRAKEKGGALVDSALGQNMAITSHNSTNSTGATRMARRISRMSSPKETRTLAGPGKVYSSRALASAALAAVAYHGPSQSSLATSATRTASSVLIRSTIAVTSSTQDPSANSYTNTMISKEKPGRLYRPARNFTPAWSRSSDRHPLVGARAEPGTVSRTHRGSWESSRPRGGTL